jgi:hypothetical protein
MISVTEFYKALGIENEVPDGDFVVLDEKVSVLAQAESITLIFDSINATPQELKRIFEVSRVVGEAVPFTTKSGKLGMKLLSNSVDIQNTPALSKLDTVLGFVLND